MHIRSQYLQQLACAASVAGLALTAGKMNAEEPTALYLAPSRVIFSTAPTTLEGTTQYTFCQTVADFQQCTHFFVEKNTLEKVAVSSSAGVREYKKNEPGFLMLELLYAGVKEKLIAPSVARK